MPRYIDADAYKAKLIEKLEEAINSQKVGAKVGNIDKMVKAEYTLEAFIESIFALNDTPTADVVEQKCGKWLWVDGVRCSICNHKLRTTGIPSFCPNCGARMEERREDAEIH